jgi:hypothetical protein
MNGAGGAHGSASRVRLATAALLVLTAPACSNLLGIEDRTLSDDAGSGTTSSSSSHGADATAPAADASLPPTPDGASDSGAPNDDALPVDAGPPSDASLDCGSTCAPIALVSSSAGYFPLAMAQDDTNLYWTDLYGTVLRMDKDGGALTPIYTYTQSSFPGTIAVSDASVYWSDNDGVWQCPKSGCGASGARRLVVPVTPNKNDIHSLAIDDVNAYWTDDSALQVESAPLTGADAGKRLWIGMISPEQVTTDGQRVYFTADDGLLHVVATDGGAVMPSTLGTPNDAGALGIAYENQTVFWTVSSVGTGQVMQTSTASLAATSIAAGQNTPSSVASDGLNVYWLDFGLNANGELLGCTILNCKPVSLYGPIQTPRAVLVDGTSIYWIDQGTSSIWRILK